MINKIFTGVGISGLVDYITHDSPTADDRHPDTTGRVGHVESLGLADVDPAIMTRCMQGLTADQRRIKIRAGTSTRGRLLKEPYLHLINSYPVGEIPGIDQIRKDNREALRAIGISDRHYGVMAVHTDRDHLHVHTAVSRIDPETGIAATLSHAHVKLSKWAHEYERRIGRIVAPARAARWDRKDGDPYPAPAPRLTRDAIGRPIVRTPNENQEWHQTLVRQKREKTPRSQARKECADLSRRQTAARLTAEHERADVRAKRCRALTPSKPPRPVSIAPTPERPRRDLARIDIAVPALPGMPRPVSIAPTPERTVQDRPQVPVIKGVVRGAGRPAGDPPPTRTTTAPTRTGPGE